MRRQDHELDLGLTPKDDTEESSAYTFGSTSELLSHEAALDAESHFEDLEGEETIERHDDVEDDHGGRFRVGPEIGVGGMGRVSLVRDQRLLRDVAWKRGDWWLLREARVLAQLEHPGIVPIHDMGFDADGRPYFAMRVVKGRSLSELLRTTPTNERLGLLRPLLQAAEAVAYAHHRGVIHRDLKPANIMIGRFGESQVVDWGLARVLEDGEDPIPEEVAQALSGRELGRVGTAGYMSPEQERAEPADRRSDVFSLGRILARILGVERDAELSGAPLELRAIVDKSTASRPADRYADASAFAADLERYLDGRRVSAHTYGQRELLRRFFRRHRLPILVAVVGAVALVVLGVLYVVEVDTERDRAQRAATATQQALSQSDAHLARSLVGEARRLLGVGARAEAEILAAHSLTLAEDPEARGVLSSLFGAPALEVVWRRELDCADSQVEPVRELVMCSTPEAVELWDVSVSPALRRWRRELPVRSARVTTGGIVVGSSVDADVVFFDWDGVEVLRQRSRHSVTRKSASDGSLAIFVSATTSMVADTRARHIHQVLVCGESLHAALMVRDDERYDGARAPLAVGLCKDGTLIVGERRVATDLRVPEREGVLLDRVGRDRVVVGTTKGEVVVLSTEGHVITALPLVHGMVRLLLPSPDGRHLAVAGEGDPIIIVTLPDLALVTSLPRRAKNMAWDYERPGELVSTGSWVERWRLAPHHHLRPIGGAHLIHLKDGVVALDIDPAGPERIAVSFGPHIGVLDSRGARSRQLGVVTVKGGSFDGERLMAAGSRGIFELDADTLELIDEEPVARLAVRRFTTLADGTRLVTPYADLRRYDPRPHGAISSESVLSDSEVSNAICELDYQTESKGSALDLSVSSNRRFAIFLHESDRSLVRVRADQPGAEVVGVDILAEAAAISAEGERIFTARAGSVAEWDDRGYLVRVFDAGDAKLIDVEVSPDGRWVAAGGREGSVWIWASGRSEALARFSDHTERVPALVFSSDSKVLISGSWDRTLRVRDLDVLEAPIGPVGAKLRQRYAMDLVEALGGR